MRRLVLVGILTAVGCGSDNGSPTGPSNTPPAPETRVIQLDGTLSFGAVTIGQSSTLGFTIRNTGNAMLTVTGMTVPGGSGSMLSVNWSDGTIPANSSQEVRVRYAPTSTASFSGNLTVNGNHTSGTNTIPISGSGTVQGLPIYFHSGVGASVFDVPRHVSRVKITGNYSGRCENFIISIAGRTVVNEILGTCSVADSRNYEGTHLISGGAGGTAEVRESNQIHWTITEVR